MLSVVEICAGAGGQARGLERAGFEHRAAIEIDKAACATLRLNRPSWHVIEEDVHNVSGVQFGQVDLFAGGVPCPPFSLAGKQLGKDDERDLFPEALRMIAEMKPRAENTAPPAPVSAPAPPPRPSIEMIQGTKKSTVEFP